MKISALIILYKIAIYRLRFTEPDAAKGWLYSWHISLTTSTLFSLTAYQLRQHYRRNTMQYAGWNSASRVNTMHGSPGWKMDFRMKITFNASINALGSYCLCISRILVPLCMCVMRYGLRHCHLFITATSAKISRKKERAWRVVVNNVLVRARSEGYIVLACCGQLVSIFKLFLALRRVRQYIREASLLNIPIFKWTFVNLEHKVTCL